MTDPQDTIEPWHELETAYDAECGPALVFKPSGRCAVGCVRPGCTTMKAFAEQDVRPPQGVHRIRARRTPSGDVVLDIEPIPADGNPDRFATLRSQLYPGADPDKLILVPRRDVAALLAQADALTRPTARQEGEGT